MKKNLPPSQSIFRFITKLEGLPIAMVLVTLYIIFTITAPRVFTGYRIYMSFLQTVPPMLVCSLGLTFVITAGEIDLSFSAVIALAGFAFAWAYTNIDSPLAPLIGIILALGAGALVGFINGWLVAKIGVPSIMATLAAQFFWSGFTVLISNGRQINLSGIDDTFVNTIFTSRLGGIVPVQAIWVLGLAIFLWFILNRHRFGESVMFIGDNPDVAQVVGIDIVTTKIQLFVLNGVLAAFGALLLTIDRNTFWPTQGEGYLLLALASVFIGGTSIAGGRGLIVGTFFGAYIMGSLEAGVVASGIGGYFTRSAAGIVMAASVVLNIAIDKGQLTNLYKGLRRWSGQNPTPLKNTEMSKQDDRTST